MRVLSHYNGLHLLTRTDVLRKGDLVDPDECAGEWGLIGRMYRGKSDATYRTDVPEHLLSCLDMRLHCWIEVIASWQVRRVFGEFS